MTVVAMIQADHIPWQAIGMELPIDRNDRSKHLVHHMPLIFLDTRTSTKSLSEDYGEQRTARKALRMTFSNPTPWTGEPDTNTMVKGEMS